MKDVNARLLLNLAPFTIGGDLNPKTEQCSNKPIVMITEKKPPEGEEGPGSMSLCGHCLNQFKKQMDLKDYDIEGIE